MEKIYIINELYFYTMMDYSGSQTLSRGFTDRDKAWEFVKNLTMSEPESVSDDDADDSRYVRVVVYETGEVIEYHIDYIEVEL